MTVAHKGDGSNDDDRFMALALRAGRRGRPSPNPHVGAVVVKRGQVIATGFHRKAGEAHAEVMALCRAKGRARGATLYVTLEPCNHTGRTPPCTEAIIKAQVKRVVVGARDPDPHVPGALARLRRNGIAVTVGVRRVDAEALVADFAKHRRTKFPFVTLKAAVTLDGRIATRTRGPASITGPLARRDAHRQRDRSDAVLVGIGTVLADDPLLTVRDVVGRTPLRVVLDRALRMPPSAALVRTARQSPVLVYHGPRVSAARRLALTRAGVTLMAVPLERAGAGLSLAAVLGDLGGRDVVRLLVEGGAKVHGAFLAAGAVDRVVVYVAPKLLADPEAVPLALGPAVALLEDGFVLRQPDIKILGHDVRFEGRVTRGSLRGRAVDPAQTRHGGR